MTQTLEPRIIESLHAEAMCLADEVRDTFDMSGRMDAVSESEDLARIALSCEALRATTRMMHVIAWLLNQKAYLNGELSAFQLRRHGRLPREKAAADEEQLALLPRHIRDLVERTRNLHDRIARIDEGWTTLRDDHNPAPEPRHGALGLQQRLGRAIRNI
ncbi:MAG: DUF1465 family protein [Caenibius sp.]